MYSLLSAASNLVLTSHLRQQGFDEFMNLVIDEAAEVYVKEAKPRKELGTLRRHSSEVPQA
jgi:hypothetical protein